MIIIRTQVEFYLTEMRSDNTRTKAQEGEAAQFESYAVEATNGIVADYYRSFYNVIFRANIVLANLDAASGATATQFEAEASLYVLMPTSNWFVFMVIFH